MKKNEHQTFLDWLWQNLRNKVLKPSCRQGLDPASYAKGRSDGCSDREIPDDPGNVASCEASYVLGHIDGRMEARKNRILDVKL